MEDFGGKTPPETLSGPLKALWWLRKGGLRMGAEWEKAHDICQSDEGNPGHDRVHALVHLIEGDRFNADYWYRRCGKPYPGEMDFDEEAAVILKALG